MSHCHFVTDKSHIHCPRTKPLFFYPEEGASTFQNVETYLQSTTSQKAILSSLLFYYCNLYSCLTRQCHTRCIHTLPRHVNALHGPCNNIKSRTFNILHYGNCRHFVNDKYQLAIIKRRLTSNENIYLVLFHKLQSLRIPVYLVWTFVLLTELSQIK